MKSFRSQGAPTYLPELGWIIYIENDVLRNEPNMFSDLKPLIKIDNIVYLVRGIESFAVTWCKPGWFLGILIEGVPR